MGGFGGMSGFVGDQMAGVPNWLWPLMNPKVAAMMGLGGMLGSPSPGGIPGAPEPTMPASPGGVAEMAAEPSAAGAAASPGGGYRKGEVTQPTDWQDLLKRLTKPRPEPSRLQSFAAFAGPVMQILASAFAAPSRGHRYGRPFLGGALAGGSAALQTLAGRPQAKWQQGLEQAGREYGARVGIAKATAPTAKEETLYDVFDKKRGEAVKATAAQIQGEPERYVLVPPKPGAESNPDFQHVNIGGQDRIARWDPTTQTFVPLDVQQPSGPVLNPATTGPGQFWLNKAYNPETAGDLVTPSGPTRIPAAVYHPAARPVAAKGARPTKPAPSPKPRMGTPQQSANLEKWKANEFAKLEKEILLDPVELAQKKQGIEDAYGQQLQALGGTWKRTVYAPSSNPYHQE